MKEEILINVASGETRVAIVEDGVCQEVVIERASRLGLVSNIYQGIVRRVLPGMQAAFIDIGLERTAFLHVSDIAKQTIDDNGIDLGDAVNIRELIRDGDSILVQVVKDPMGTKGARLTTFITIPSRYLVFMPNGQGVGVSTRIDDEVERARLREIVMQFIDPDTSGGYIVRTAAEGAQYEALRADMMFLSKLWTVVNERGKQASGPELIYEDLPLHKRILRDVLSADIERIRVDSEQAFSGMSEFARTFIPELAPVIEQYVGDRPLFDMHNVEEEIQKALERKVELKSGGYLIIDQTEAMTTVDVNTGAYVGHRNLEDTIFKTNLEAAQGIARQLRLRNLGGIIILDFIDMSDEEHRRQVLQALEKYLSRDHVKFFVSEVTQLGLVEMTRKRTRESLEHITCEPCSSCNGRGYVKTAETVCYEIFREIVRQNRQFEFQKIMILASQEVIDVLLDEESSSLAELELTTGKPIRLQSEASYQVEFYDVVLM